MTSVLVCEWLILSIPFAFIIYFPSCAAHRCLSINTFVFLVRQFAPGLSAPNACTPHWYDAHVHHVSLIWTNDIDAHIANTYFLPCQMSLGHASYNLLPTLMDRESRFVWNQSPQNIKWDGEFEENESKTKKNPTFKPRLAKTRFSLK